MSKRVPDWVYIVGVMAAITLFVCWLRHAGHISLPWWKCVLCIPLAYWPALLLFLAGLGGGGGTTRKSGR